MTATSVTSKGQVTIPKNVRLRLGIRKGTRVAISLVGDHAELRVATAQRPAQPSGFGLLKSRRGAVPANFDPAGLLKR